MDVLCYTCLDGQERDAGALVSEGEVHSFLVDRDGLGLCVDDIVSSCVEPAFPCSYPTCKQQLHMITFKSVEI